MTCIVGMLDGHGGAAIGGDSAGVVGLTVTIRSDVKVFRKGEFVIGFAGSYRMGQILQYHFQPPPVRRGTDHHEYMVTSFIEAARECFKGFGFASTINAEEAGEEVGGDFLVAFKNHLYHIGPDYQVGVLRDGFAAIGCGSDFALGAMKTLEDTHISTEDKILKALKAAEYFSVGVAAPFVVVSTSSEKKTTKKKAIKPSR